MKKRALLIVLSALTIGWVDVSHAAETDRWEFQCMPNHGNNNDNETVGELCTTEISTSHEGNDFVIYFAHSNNETSPLVVSGPVELFFVDATIKVHGKTRVSADICEVGLCYFRLKKSALLLQQFAKGKSARITISTDQHRTILDKDITLSGFLAAFWKFQTVSSLTVEYDSPANAGL